MIALNYETEQLINSPELGLGFNIIKVTSLRIELQGLVDRAAASHAQPGSGVGGGDWSRDKAVMMMRLL